MISFTGAFDSEGRFIYISSFGLGKSPGNIGVLGELKVYITILGSAICGINVGIKFAYINVSIGINKSGRPTKDLFFCMEVSIFFLI